MPFVSAPSFVPLLLSLITNQANETSNKYVRKDVYLSPNPFHLHQCTLTCDRDRQQICLKICRREVWYSEALFRADTVAFPRRVAPLELSAFFLRRY